MCVVCKNMAVSKAQKGAISQIRMVEKTGVLMRMNKIGFQRVCANKEEFLRPSYAIPHSPLHYICDTLH